MRNSVTVQATIAAYKKGYRVTDVGEVVSPKGRVLKLNETGVYLRFSVNTVDRRVFKVKVHQLAGYQWFGPMVFEDGISIRHLDGCPKNNKRNNLACGTQSDNAFDVPGNIRREHALTAARTRRRLTIQQAEELRQKRLSGATYKTLCQEYGICKSLVSYIVNNKTYACGE